MNETSRGRCALIAAAAAACVAAALNAWLRRGQIFGPLDDETLLVPIAMRTCGLATFTGDSWLATVAPVFSVPYSWIVGSLLRAVDDPVVALRWLSIPFHALFLLGTWRLAERFAGRAAGIAALALCTLPPFAPLVFVHGAALPRDLVFALVPWFVLGAESADARRGALVYFGLGVAANLHPLTALHAAMWLLGIELVRDASAAGLKRAILRGMAFLVGAAPYVVQYVSLPRHPGAVDPVVYAWRLGSMAGETWGPWATRMEPVIWLGAAAGVVAVAARRKIPRWFLIGAAVAFVLAATGPVLGQAIVPLRAFQFARFERFAAWCEASILAVGVVAAWRARRFAALAAAVVLVAVALLGPVVAGDNAGRSPIGRAGRWIDRRAGVPYERPSPPGLLRRTPAPSVAVSESSGAFLDVCRFAREQTPEDSLFVVPPESWGAFRVYARRGATVTLKEGGAALSFLGAGGMDWYRDYEAVVAAYSGRAGPDFALLVPDRGARFVVVDAATPGRPAWPVAFEAGPYRVHAVPTK